MACNMMDEEGFSLKHVLDAISQAGFSLGVRRALAYRAIEMAMLSHDRYDEMAAFEAAMSSIREIFGDLSIAAAVQRLRAEGHVQLARRLRGASSRRNERAHPDPGLARELMSLASAGKAAAAPRGYVYGDGVVQLVATRAAAEAPEQAANDDRLRAEEG